jgi:Zn-dependent protease with chaperone function
MTYNAAMPQRRFLAILLLFAILLACPLRAAAQPPAAPDGPVERPASAPIASPVSAPIRLPEASPRIIAYNRFWYTLYFAGTAWQALGLVLLIRLRAAPRLRDAAEKRTRFLFLQAAWVWVGFSLLLALWQMPLGAVGYLHERGYGFATLSPWLWLADRGRGWLLGLVNVLVVWAGYRLLRWQPRRWWLWLWAASIPWQFAMIVVRPALVDTQYNRFEPLPDGPLRQRLLKLAEDAGIEGARVYQVDISRRTTKLNAYVTGLGPTKRIVLWDNTLKALSDDETVAIMAHEIGHYVLAHMWWRLAEGIAGAFALLWLLSRMLPWAVSRWGARRDVRDAADLGGLPIAYLAVMVLIFAQTPVESALSRIHERAADRYAVETTGLREPLARAFVAFVEKDYGDPDPPRFLVWWFYSHPPLRERVEFALRGT